MEAIIPQSITDKINVLFTYVKNLYNSFHDLTTKYFVVDNSNNFISVKGNYFTINTTSKYLNFGDPSSPQTIIFYGTDNPESIIYEETIPGGSLFLTQNNGGEGYLYVNDSWEKIVTTPI